MATDAAGNSDVVVQLSTFSAPLPSWITLENGVAVQEGNDSVTDVARLSASRGMTAHAMRQMCFLCG